MLALNRKLGQSIWIGNTEIRVTELHRGQVRLCINAPKNLEVLRDELRTSPIPPGKFEVPVPRVSGHQACQTPTQ